MDSGCNPERRNEVLGVFYWIPVYIGGVMMKNCGASQTIP
jgi:hypothetical protein